jgi:hypothetical protein
VLDRHGTTVPDTIATTLARFDVAARLRDGGLTDAEIDAVRRRLVG